MIGSQFKLYDLSTISEIEEITVQESIAPLTISCGPTAKGPEGTQIVSGDTFRKLYGDPNYNRYGQVSIQNQRVIDNKGKILFRRLVADDATLASAVIVANVYSEEVQKTNAQGELMYSETQQVQVEGTDGSTTTETITVETTSATAADGSDNTPIMESTAKYFYDVKYMGDDNTATEAKTMADVYDAFKALYTGEEEDITLLETDESGASKTVKGYVYPLFVVTDNGRGSSEKGFYIEPENSLSKNLPFMYYTLNIVEGGDVTDECRFCMLPNKIYNNECIDIDSAAETYLTQVEVKSYPEATTAFIEKISEFSGLEIETIEENDILFGNYRKGTPLEQISAASTEYTDLTNVLGIMLAGGQNGEFGDAPASDPEAVKIINQKTLEFFSGTGDTEDKYEVFNLDVYQIDACFDAGFPFEVKEAIVKLAEYRKDFMFFRDTGFDVKNLDDVKDMAYKFTHSTWATNYCQYYDIYDPYTLKKETVTITYDLAPMIINHLYNGRHLPFAGLRNNAVITSIADKKSLNYSPKILPQINEKDDMEDVRFNFACYYQDNLILESLYTSQDAYTQLSFSNNVMAVQMVIKALRTKFPAIRYQYITSMEDVKTTQQQINDFLSTYEGYFSELYCEYIEDKKYLQNKIYRCSLYFRFNEFTQGELVDAYMLPSNII